MMKNKATAETLPHRRFLELLRDLGNGRTALSFTLLPSARDYLEAKDGGLPFRYVVGQHKSRVELYVARHGSAANKRFLDGLKSRKSETEAIFGGELRWEDCRVSFPVAGGVKDHEAKWREIQESLIDAMAALEKAIRPLIDIYSRTK